MHTVTILHFNINMCQHANMSDENGGTSGKNFNFTKSAVSIFYGLWEVCAKLNFFLEPKLNLDIDKMNVTRGVLNTALPSIRLGA